MAVGVARPSSSTAQYLAAPCASPSLTDPRDPANPLDLPTATAANPLAGAHFFVDGPRHGAAAQAIESLLGMSNTSFADTDTWDAFVQQVDARLPTLPASTAATVRALLKIGSQEETQNVSQFAMGGGTGAIYSQTQKLLCGNMRADPTPNTVPVFSTFFIYPHGKYCPSAAELAAWWPTFTRYVDEMAAAIGSSRAVVLMEIDAVGTVWCKKGKARSWWLKMLRYEAQAFGALPHVLAYMEAGSKDEGDALKTAKVLVQAGIDLVRGFWTNATHFNWSIAEIRRNDAIVGDVARLYAKQHVSYAAHYIVNTAQNGQGPKLNAHPKKGKVGVEDLCNPPGRGLGRLPTGDTNPTFDGLRFPSLDAFLWTGVPGRSHGTSCYPGAAAPGVFDPRFATELAAGANQQLGPDPQKPPIPNVSRPY
jgi:endoglucanase